jgi:hypothetical protein
MVEIFNANALSMLLGVYERHAEPDVRTALHALLVPLTTGRLAMGMSAAPASGVGLAPAGEKEAAAPASATASRKRRRRELELDDPSTSSLTTVLCVFTSPTTASARIYIGSSGGSTGDADDVADVADEEQQRAQKQLATVAALQAGGSGYKGERAVQRGVKNAALAVAAQAGGYPAGALQLLLQIKTPEDPLQRDLLLRIVSAFPGCVDGAPNRALSV